MINNPLYIMHSAFAILIKILLKQENKKGSAKELPIFCTKWLIVFIKQLVGDVEALGSVGRGGSFFEDGGYGDVW